MRTFFFIVVIACSVVGLAVRAQEEVVSAPRPTRVIIAGETISYYRNDAGTVRCVSQPILVRGGVPAESFPNTECNQSRARTTARVEDALDAGLLE